MPAKNRDHEINIIRIYDAPVKLVWEAWTDEKQVAKWWGPRGFTLTTHSKELKVGGIWHYTMHGPDGVDYPNKTLYHQIEKYSKLVYDHGGYDDRPPLFRVTVTFEEHKGKTKMDMTMAFPSPEIAKEMSKFIKQAGGNSTWDRLAEYLDAEIRDKETFVINRSFNVSQEKMFDLWSKPEHISQWMGPTGSEMEFISADIRPGGKSFYVMTMPGVKMYGLIHYIQIQRADLIVYTQQFCDENQKISRHPMAPTWPETMLTHILFSQEGPEKTRVTITWEVHGKCSPQEIDTFIKGRAGMTQGWTGSFDKLEEYLAKV